MKENLIQRISSLLFGYRYWSIISYANGTPRCAVHGIYRTKAEARKVLREISASFSEVEIVSFRSRNIYTIREDNLGTYWTLDN